MRRIRIRKDAMPSHYDAVYTLGYRQGAADAKASVQNSLRLLDDMLAAEIDYRKLKRALQDKLDQMLIRQSKIQQFIYQATRNNHAGLSSRETEIVQSDLTRLGEVMKECRTQASA